VLQGLPKVTQGEAFGLPVLAYVRELVQQESGRRCAARDENGITKREARNGSRAEAPSADAQWKPTTTPACPRKYRIRGEETRGELEWAPDGFVTQPARNAREPFDDDAHAAQSATATAAIDTAAARAG